jgi:hypothetical protein
VTFTESGLTYSFVVQQAGSLSEVLGITLTSADVVAGAISLARQVALYQAPVISGTVAPSGSGNSNFGGATVELFAGPCSATGARENTTPVVDSSDTFTFPATASAVTAGDHCLVVTDRQGNTTREGRLTITVTKNATGAATVAAVGASTGAVLVTLAP